MATSKPSASGRGSLSSQMVVKEGFLNKKGSIMKNWRRRYFILNRQSLVYFRREQDLEAGSLKPGLSPLGRMFLSDIVNIEKEGIENKKSFIFSLHVKKHAVFLQAHSAEEREGWITAIQSTLESEGEAEKKDPFRKSLRRLAPGLKRVTLMKDPEKGIGCTVKSAAGHVFVNRIIEDGPIAHTGVLRPDDELLDVNGVTIAGMTIAEVGQVIQGCPEQFLATVRPITALKKIRPANVARVNYVTVIPNLGVPPTNKILSSQSSGTDSELQSDDSLDGDPVEGSPPLMLEDIHAEEGGGSPPIPAHIGGQAALTSTNQQLTSSGQEIGQVVPKTRPRMVHDYEDVEVSH